MRRESLRILSARSRRGILRNPFQQFRSSNSDHCNLNRRFYLRIRFQIASSDRWSSFATFLTALAFTRFFPVSAISFFISLSTISSVFRLVGLEIFACQSCRGRPLFGGLVRSASWSSSIHTQLGSIKVP